MSRIQLDNQNLQEWPAIQANATDIRISNNQLSEIPDSIGTLTSLTRIIASNNNISKISNKLTSLNQFVDLRLDGNNLLEIPKLIFELKNLKILILANNNIETIVSSIGDLAQLDQLYLQNNQIKSLPSTIGNLTNLTHLLLGNNPIEYLPPSIINCTKIVSLDVEGTNLPLPSPYNPKQVKQNIEYILENQKEPLPELSIKKAFVFKNFSKPSLIEKLDDTLKEYSTEIEVDFINIINLESINAATTSVIIIIGFDVHEDQELVFNIINKCVTNNVPYKILYQKDIESIDDSHPEKGAEFQLMRKKFTDEYTQEINSFNSKEELKGLILNVLQQHSPIVQLISLELVNIGHFENVTIPFDSNLTCLIGENGQGKSSILRSLALAIVGLNNNKIKDDPSLNDLLRIKSISQDGKIIYNDTGKIKLSYLLDSTEYNNEIIITSKDEGRVIDMQAEGDFELNSSEFNLKTLIVGFPQLRGRINQIDSPNVYSQPHIDDLIPLVKNTDDSRLDSFVGWIANLYGEAIKSDDPKETKEFVTIEYVFKVISALTGKTMSFSTVQKFSPPIVIVTSDDSPNGIPLNLISQGFKIAIGWIGYFIERKVEAFPLSSPENSANEQSILIIDEIDSSIHPLWQARLLSVLRDTFPGTQIICTTHSPLMVAGLDRNQILEIKNTDGKININQSEFDTWVTTYTQILKNIFNTHEFVPNVTTNELKSQLKEYEGNPEKLLEINENIDRLTESEALADQLLQYENTLDERAKSLDALIAEYSKKASK